MFDSATMSSGRWIEEYRRGKEGVTKKSDDGVDSLMTDDRISSLDTIVYIYTQKHYTSAFVRQLG